MAQFDLYKISQHHRERVMGLFNRARIDVDNFIAVCDELGGLDCRRNPSDVELLTALADRLLKGWEWKIIEVLGEAPDVMIGRKL